MARDERLLPLPTEIKKLQVQDVTPSTYAPVYDADPFSERRSIREYLNVVLKRKWMILAIVTVATVSTAIYMYRLPSQYQAQTQISIEPRRAKQSKDSININFGAGDATYRNTQLKLIQSPELMRDVVVSLGLHKKPTLFDESNTPGMFGRMGNAITGANKENANTSSLPVLTEESVAQATDKTQILTPEEEKRADAYARALVGGLSVEPDERSYLVMLRYNSTDRNLAVNIPNAVAKVFIAQDILRETEGTKQQSEDNIRQIADLQKTINDLENDRIIYLKDSGLPLKDGDKGENLVAARLNTYSEQWLQAEDELRKLKAAYDAALRAKASGQDYVLGVFTDSKAIESARIENQKRTGDLEKRIEAIDKEIGDLETKKSELLARYTEEYRDVKIITAQLESKKQEKERVQKEVSAKIEQDSQKLKKQAVDEVLATLKTRYDAASKREAALRQQYFQERTASNEQGQAEIKLTTLTQQIDTNRKLLDQALQRQKELELAVSSTRPDNIKVTNEAQQASLVGPRRNTSILIAFLIALASGVGLAFLLNYLDDSVKSSDDVGRHLGLPTLALIPYNNLDAPKTKQLPNASVNSTALVTLDDAQSAIAEAYRHLRTSLLFSSAGKPPQTILVTSSQPSEGKTTTAINTAITLAQSGAEVVIIDCDLRRPRLHQHFRLDNMNGLTNYLSGERNTELLLKTHDRMPNLKIITSGPIPPNPAEMLGSNEMRGLIDFLRSNFKHVVIDSPPAISFTDATILATLVDGVVIVAMVGKSSIHLIRRFKQRLNGIGARIYGVVLNGLKRGSLDYGYGYYGYGYSYYYADNEEDKMTKEFEETDK
jgi:polysaccharide biosynthesis transport protein